MITIDFFMPEDIKNCYKLIHKLAIYEGVNDNSIISLCEFKKMLSPINPIYNVLMAKENGKIIGIATYYYRYSSWKGKHIHLEDLFVEEEFRNKRIGSQLFKKLTSVAKNEKLKRIEWEVRYNNENAKKFYNKLSADVIENWQICRLELN